jgi:acyl carrier protein
MDKQSNVSIDMILDVVRSAGTKVDLDALDATSDLVALGADSLDMMTILLDIQDRTGIEIPDEDVDRLRTPKAIRDYVAGRGQLDD